jgi:hypothetical protein
LKLGVAGAIETLPKGIRQNREAVAETIINNVRPFCAPGNRCRQTASHP